MADKQSSKTPPTSAKPLGPKAPVQLGGESLVERLMPHVKKILIGVVVLAAVVTVVFTIKWMKIRDAQEATDKVAATFAISEQATAFDVAQADPKNAPKQVFDTGKARAAAVLAEAVKQGATLPLGARAGLELDAGKLDDAIADYRAASTAPGLDGVLAREGLGIALETKASAEKDAAARQKGLEDALAAFVSEQPDEAGPRRAYALYHQGRLLGPKLLNKPADAKAALTKAKELAKDPHPDALLIDDTGRPQQLEALADMIQQQLIVLGGA